MYSKELEAIIEAALVDGIITEKEREVIKKRALDEGVNPDEMDLILDSEIQKIRQKQLSAMNKVKKCPNCGEVMPVLNGICPSCGHTVDVNMNDNKELFKLIDDMENALVELKSGNVDVNKQTAIIEKYRRMAHTLYAENKKVQYLLAEIDAELKNYKKAVRKKTLIRYILKYGSIILIPLLIYTKCQMDSSKEEQELLQIKQQYEQQYELDKPFIDNQYETLCKQIDDLPLPNESNYKIVTKDLLNIVWNDISKDYFYSGMFNIESIRNDYEYKLRSNFVAKKEAYAEQLQVIYKRVYKYNQNKYDKDNTYYYNNTPDEIEFINFYR